jgi:hypothetical protein
VKVRHPLLIALFVVALHCQAAAGATLEIAVRHSSHGEPLRLDSLRYLNATGETLSFTRLGYLLSGFAVEREDGVWVETPNQYAWIDEEKRRTAFRLDAAPSGTYRALRFHIGPDATANASDPASLAPAHPLNANLNGLHWNWQGGYTFLAIEGHYRSGSGELKGFAPHLARDPNRTRVSLATQIDPTKDAGVLLDFDIGTLLNAPRPIALSPALIGCVWFVRNYR